MSGSVKTLDKQNKTPAFSKLHSSRKIYFLFLKTNKTQENAREKQAKNEGLAICLNTFIKSVSPSLSRVRLFYIYKINFMK